MTLTQDSSPDGGVNVVLFVRLRNRFSDFLVAAGFLMDSSPQVDGIPITTLNGTSDGLLCSSLIEMKKEADVVVPLSVKTMCDCPSQEGQNIARS